MFALETREYSTDLPLHLKPHSVTAKLLVFQKLMVMQLQTVKSSQDPLLNFLRFLLSGPFKNLG